MTGNLSATAYNDILVLPTLWQQFVFVLFLIQHDNAPMHKVRSVNKWYSKFSLEELLRTLTSSPCNTFGWKSRVLQYLYDVLSDHVGRQNVFIVVLNSHRRRPTIKEGGRRNNRLNMGITESFLEGIQRVAHWRSYRNSCVNNRKKEHLREKFKLFHTFIYLAYWCGQQTELSDIDKVCGEGGFTCCLTIQQSLLLMYTDPVIA